MGRSLLGAKPLGLLATQVLVFVDLDKCAVELRAIELLRRNDISIITIFGPTQHSFETQSVSLAFDEDAHHMAIQNPDSDNETFYQWRTSTNK